MTGVATRDMSERGDDEDWDPLEVIEGLVDEARRLEPIEDDVPPHDDPIEGLEARIERARRMAEGEGAEALRRLEDRIERARWIPEPEPYRRPDDPLGTLQARARGEDPLERGVDGGRPEPAGETGGVEAGATPTPASGEQDDVESVDAGGGRHRQLGEALEASLRSRDLPGPVRAEVAARLAELMGESSREELEEIWELVVFGETGD